MSYHQLFNHAYGLCIKFNSHAIADDLAYMSESELMGVIYLFMRLKES